MDITRVHKFCCGWMDGRVPDCTATSGPKLTAEAEFSSVKLVSWGQVWQKLTIFVSNTGIDSFFVS